MEENPSFGQGGGGGVVLPSPRPLTSSRGRAVVLARPRGVREPGQEVKWPKFLYNRVMFSTKPGTSFWTFKISHIKSNQVNVNVFAKHACQLTEINQKP